MERRKIMSKNMFKKMGSQEVTGKQLRGGCSQRKNNRSSNGNRLRIGPSIPMK